MGRFMCFYIVFIPPYGINILRINNSITAINREIRESPLQYSYKHAWNERLRIILSIKNKILSGRQI